MDIALEALMPLRYDGRIVARGESFVVRSAFDAQVLLLLQKAKHATPADTDPAPKRRPSKRSDAPEAA